jgi:hypothetical protein
MTGVLAEALQLKLHPAMHYVRARRTGLLRYASTRPIYQRCLFRPDFRVLKPLSGTNQYHFKI